MKWVVALFCVPLAGFCLFGFLATFEPGAPAATLFRIGYAITGGAAIAGAVWPFFASKST